MHVLKSSRVVWIALALGLAALLVFGLMLYGGGKSPLSATGGGGTTEGIRLKGIVELVVIDAKGNVKSKQTIENLITDNGLEDIIEATFFRSGMVGMPVARPAPYNWITFDAGDTKIFTPNNWVLTIEEVDEPGEISLKNEPLNVVVIKAAISGVEVDAPAIVTKLYIVNAALAADVRPVTAQIFSEITTAVALDPADLLIVTWTIIVEAS